MKRLTSFRYGALVVLVGLAVLVGLRGVYAIQIPPRGSVAFIQTSGPDAPLGNGDYYTSTQGDNGPHVIDFVVPCAWTATEPITVSIYDPESNIPNPSLPALQAIDQIRPNAAPVPDNTEYTLTAPGGATVGPVVFTPDGGSNGLWVELVTFTPDIAGFGCGTYTLETTTATDDEQSWRLRITQDPDCTVSIPNPGTCSGIGQAQSDLLFDGDAFDDLDGVPGTGDELLIGLLKVSFEHAGPQCQTFYFFVDEGPALLHNFDMDNRTSITYTLPNGRIVDGTLSTQGNWNNGTAGPPFPPTRVGDEVATQSDDEFGWWEADVCTDAANQYIFEGEEGEPIFYQQPPTPRLEISKDDGSSVTSPGALLTYTITFTNTSDQTTTPGAATNVVLTEQLPANATFQSCTLIDPAGACDTSQAASGTLTLTVDGDFDAGQVGRAQVTVRVDDDASDTVENTVCVDYNDLLDNQFPQACDTDTNTLEDGPVVVATKVVTTLNSLANQPCEALTGETLEYTVQITNTGTVTATSVAFNDELDSNTTLVDGSIATSVGTVDGTTAPIVSIGDLASGASVTITYRAIVTGALTGETDIVNQGRVGGANFAAIVTDDPTTVAGSDPTTTVACPPPVNPAAPLLEATKRVNALDTNAVGECQVLAGETLEYTVVVSNNGDAPVAQTRFTDTPDANTRLLTGSVQTTRGRVTQGNFADETTVGVNIGTLSPGEQATIFYRTVITNPLDQAQMMLVNQGRAQGQGVDDTLTDDPTTTDVGDPTTILACNPGVTAIGLEEFTATWQGDTVVVQWTTSAEINTWGFHLLRSSDGNRASAERVTTDLILAEGQASSGASYTWTDTDTTPGVTYTYWLEEVELDRSTNEYGPAATAALSADQGIFLPLIVR